MSTSTTGHLADQTLLRERVGAAHVRRDVVRVVGTDAVSYLQGQVSQDLEGLTPGVPSWALVLEPGGRVDAWVRVWAAGPEEVLLDLDAGTGAALLQRLDRFRLRVAAELELLDWEMVSIRGPETPDPDSLASDARLVAQVDWAGLPGLDLLGPTVSVPEGIPTVDPAALDVVRVEAGRPAMGRELGPTLDPLVIPAEAGDWLIEASVSFTKGCYTGQELVARVDARGSNTPRKLRGVVLGGTAVPPAGAELVVDDKTRGVVTSSGWSARLDAPIALSYVHRSVEADAEVQVTWTGGDGPLSAVGRVRELPLVAG